MCVARGTKMNKNIMYAVYVKLLCFLQTVLAQPINSENLTFPPQGNFCFFTSSELVFEVIMTEVAPSAKLQGAGKLKDLYAYLPKLGDPVTVDGSAEPKTPLELKNLWGVVYYIAQDDYSKIEEFAYKQSMISDVMVEVHKDTSRENGQAMECLSIDTGLLPQAFPLPVHAKFCQEVCCRNYLDRLAEVGVPQDYVVSLTMLPSTSEDVPRSSSAINLFSTPLAIQHAQSDLYGAIPISTPSYELSENKFCVFTASELIFPDAMVKVAPSAMLIGAGMLMDDYIGLGGKTQPDHFVKFEGFDHVWGAAFAIDRKELYNFLAYGQQFFFFVADVQAEVKGLGRATCKTFDIGLLPTAFPFAVFKESKVDVQTYVKQLQDLGAPENYVSTISSLVNSVYLPDSTNKIGSWVY